MISVRERIKGKDYLKYAFWAMFFAQFAVIAFLNLTQMKYHLGYDAASYYLKAMEMAKQGTLFIEHWAEQTTLYFDSAVPFAAVLYKFTGNIFFSYGMVNLMIDAAIFWVFYSILSSLRMKSTSKAVCLNLISCLYIAPSFNNMNDLSYFSSTLSSGSWYGLKMLIVLMTIKMVMDLDEGKRNYLFIVVTEAFLFISGVSSGWYLLVTVIAPLLLFYLVKVFVDNQYQSFLRSSVLMLIIGAVLIVVGKYIAINVIGFESKDSSMTLIGLLDFWENLGSIILGFMELLGAFTYESNVSALGIDGIIYLLGLVIFIVCVIGCVYTVRNLIRQFNEYSKYGMLLCVVGFNFAMFAVLNTKYALTIFETRYLIPLFILLAITVGAFIDNLRDDLIFKKAGLIVLLFSLLVLNLFEDKQYYKGKNNYDSLRKVVDVVDELDTDVVYMYGDALGIDCRNLRVVDSERIYKQVGGNFNAIGHWGDYDYYDDVSEVMGRNVLITGTDTLGEEIPEYVRNQYTLYKQVKDYYIYVADTNRIDLCSGINGDRSVDFPTSNGMEYAEGIIDTEGNYVSNGAEGTVIWGPYVPVPAGTYDFIVHYEVLESGDKTADFIVSINSGKKVLDQIELDPDENTAVLSGVTLKKNRKNLEYKIYNYSGTKIKINSFEIVRQSAKE